MATKEETGEARLYDSAGEELAPYRIKPLARFIYGDKFELSISALIIVNAAILAVLTLPTISADTATILSFAEHTIYAIFVIELSLRIISFGKKPWRYFSSRWNIFDFLVIALVPLSSGATTILRLLKILRVIRLFRFLPEFQTLAIALGRTITPVGSAFLLISMFMFLYAMAGVYIFGENDPVHWGDIGVALVTLTILITLENFPETFEAGLEYTPLAWVYFVSFMVIIVFTILNILIGIVLNAMAETRKDSENGGPGAKNVSAMIGKLHTMAERGTLSDEHRTALKAIVDKEKH